MSVHKQIKKQKIYIKYINQTETKGKSPKYWPTEGHLPGYSGYIVSSTGFAESLSVAKHGDVTNVYCVIKLQWIEKYQFDSPNRIDSNRLGRANRFESIFPSSTNNVQHDAKII